MRETTQTPGRWLLVGLVLLTGLLATEPVLAQTSDVGTISFAVVDPDGAALPGVQVDLAGPQVSWTGFTEADGTVRFAGLVPALYDATIALDGFATLVRNELRGSAGQTTLVRVSMQIAGVEEVVTVVGESPLVDVTTVNIGTTLSSEFLNLTPTASGLWSGVLDRIPGVVNPTIDVGGGNSGQQTDFSAHGSLRGQNQFKVNGVQATSLGLVPGNSTMYYALDSFDEVAVSTGAHDITSQAPGVIVDMVTKSGTNRLQGAARFTYSNDSFVGDNLDADLEEAGVSTGTPNTLLRDVNLQVGGPIVRDKLFAFANFWDFRNETLIEGAPADERDDTALRNYSLNTSWQINRDHRLSVRYVYSNKYRGNRNAGPQQPVSSARTQDGYSNALQANWQAILGPTTNLDLRAARNWGVFTLTGRRPDSANPHPDYPTGVPFTFDLGLGTASGSPFEEGQDADAAQISGNVSHYIAGNSFSHNLQFGGEYQRSRTSRVNGIPGGVLQFKIFGQAAFADLFNAAPDDVLNPIDPSTATTWVNNTFSLYAQDSITINRRLNVNIGLRYDHSSQSIPEQTRRASPWAGLIPESQNGALFLDETFPAQNGVATFGDLTPRIAVTYDLGQTGRTVAKASYGRYSLQLGDTAAIDLNGNFPGSNFYLWSDTNGDGVFQWGEQGAWLGGEFPGGTYAVDPDLRSPLMDEVTVGLEHELNRELMIGGTFMYRNTKHQQATVNTGVPYGAIAETLGVPDSYTPVEWFDPGPDGIPGTSDDGGTITVYNQDPSTFGQDFFLLTNVEKFGLDAPVEYRGFELTLRKRFSNGWQGLASWTIGKSDTGLGQGNNRGGVAFNDRVFNNPNSDINRHGASIDDRRHIVKLSGNYLIQSIGVNVGANFRYETGPPTLRTIRTPRSLLNQGSVTVSAAGRGRDTNAAGLGETLDSVTLLDMRLEKQFRLPGRGGQIALHFDAFNLFNENAVRSVNQTSGPTYGRINRIVSPRMLRLGIGWTF